MSAAARSKTGATRNTSENRANPRPNTGLDAVASPEIRGRSRISEAIPPGVQASLGLVARSRLPS